MKLRSLKAGAICAATLATTVSAQDFAAQYEAQEETRVGLSWSVPFTNRQDAVRSARTVSLSFNQKLSGVSAPDLDVLTLSFNEGPRATYGDFDAAYSAAEGEGGVFSTTRGKILLGLGAALAVWAIVEATEDDDEDIVCITEPCT